MPRGLLWNICRTVERMEEGGDIPDSDRCSVHEWSQVQVQRLRILLFWLPTKQFDLHQFEQLAIPGADRKPSAKYAPSHCIHLSYTDLPMRVLIKTDTVSCYVSDVSLMAVYNARCQLSAK